MIIRKISTSFLLALFVAQAFSQHAEQSLDVSPKDSVSDYNFSVSTTWLSFANFGEEKTNTHHYEFHVKYNLTPKDKIGIKFATWKLFATMGMPMR